MKEAIRVYDSYNKLVHIFRLRVHLHLALVTSRYHFHSKPTRNVPPLHPRLCVCVCT